MNSIFAKLRKKNRRNYYLYMACNFISLLLITAYSAMMLSPTVLTILPSGGDSRKQMFMIFAIACIGCVVFTIYAASLFYRMKSREMGIMMALGMPKRRLAAMLFQEILVISFSSSLGGILLGMPFTWCLWQTFRLFIVNSAEMRLIFDLKALFISLLFLAAVMASAGLLGMVFLKRTNILEVVNESRKSEPLRDVKKWFGPLGIVLLLAGAIMGYSAPSLYMKAFQQYPPAWLSLLYAPVFIGLYMVLLHTVIRGWKKNKNNPYKGIISRNMMKFQGRQTVNNMLVITLLIAGACFGIFYIPMLGTGQIMQTNARTYDYFYHYRSDQKVPEEAVIGELAEKYGLQLSDFKKVEWLNLGIDGETEVEDGNGKYHYEYQELCTEKSFISAGGFEILTGKAVSLSPGTCSGILAGEGDGRYWLPSELTRITNMTTGEIWSVRFEEYLMDPMISAREGLYAINDGDYEKISAGIGPKWKEYAMAFNVAGEDNYDFARELFNLLVDSTGKECEIPFYYDRVVKIRANRAGETYWGDTEDMTAISFTERNSSDFRNYWRYMPKFRILDQTDYMKNFAVFIMMFLFIAIVCITAALIIGYTRCLTIAINNRQVFLDLRRLGAGPQFLKDEIRGQVSKVFLIPGGVGMTAMYVFYVLIMYGNDGMISSQEAVGLGACFGVVALLALLIWGVYRYTLKKVISML